MRKYMFQLKWTILGGFIFYGGYSLTSSLFPLMTKKLFDHYSKGWSYLGFLFLAFLGLIVVNVLCEYLNRVWEWRLSREFKVLIKQDLFSKFISRTPEAFQQEKPAEYLSIIDNNVEAVDDDYLSANIDLLKNVVNLVIFCASMLFVLDVRITTVVVVFSVVVSLLPILTQKTLARLRKANLAGLQKYNGLLLDLLSGHKYISPRTVKVFLKRHQEHLVDAETKCFIFGRFRVISDMVNSVGTNVMNLAVFAVSGILLIQGNITLGAASAALLYTGKLIGSMSSVLSSINVLNSSKDIVADMEEQLQQPDMADHTDALPPIDRFMVRSLRYAREGYQLEVDEEQFEAGKSYAITGHSGAGKSTFLRLLNGELMAEAGAFYVDGQAIDGDTRRQSIFTLQQKEHLFAADFADNVTLFGSFPLKPQVSELLHELPPHMQARLTQFQSVDELSGGERQMISILRLINLDYPINLLDEPFSGVDSQAKQIVLDYIQKHNQHIMIEVTHDITPENLRQYDRVLRVDKGKLKEWHVAAG